MSGTFEILGPGMMAVPDVLADMIFATAGEAIVVFAAFVPGGKTSASLTALPEFMDGLKSLQARGAITVDGTSVKISVKHLLGREVNE